jgi:hypothetical protein
MRIIANGKMSGEVVGDATARRKFDLQLKTLL